VRVALSIWRRLARSVNTGGTLRRHSFPPPRRPNLVRGDGA